MMAQFMSAMHTDGVDSIEKTGLAEREARWFICIMSSVSANFIFLQLCVRV